MYNGNVLILVMLYGYSVEDSKLISTVEENIGINHLQVMAGFIQSVLAGQGHRADVTSHYVEIDGHLKEVFVIKFQTF